MPFFPPDLLPLTHFRALKHPIPTMREHFPFPRSFFLGPGTHIADFRTGQLDDFRTPRHSNTFFVFVACSDHVIVLDTVHDGRVAGSVPVGKGVDNIDYDEDSRTLYAAAAEAAQLTIAHADENGSPTVRAIVPTTKGGRSVVVGPKGCA